MREGFLLEMGLLLLLDSADVLLFVSFWVDFFLALQQVVIVNMTDANLFSIELPVLLRLEGWLLEQLFIGTFWFLGLRRHGSSLLLIKLCCLVSSLSRLQLFLFRWRLLRRVISGVLGCTRPDSCLLLPFLVIQVFVLLVRIYVWLIIFAIIFAMNVVTSLSKNNLSNRHVVSVQSILRALVRWPLVASSSTFNVALTSSFILCNHLNSIILIIFLSVTLILLIFFSYMLSRYYSHKNWVLAFFAIALFVIFVLNLCVIIDNSCVSSKCCIEI